MCERASFKDAAAIFNLQACDKQTAMAANSVIFITTLYDAGGSHPMPCTTV
jgi:hypothetical protein